MNPLLEVDDVSVAYRNPGLLRKPFTAVHHVSFVIEPGETVALVGESGSGKSTLGRAILGLTPIASGAIRFDGMDITRRTASERRQLARSLQAVFQDPYSSLNPTRTIKKSLAEPLRAQKSMTRQEARDQVHSILDRVNLPPDAADRYPSRFSGGQRQRIAIARALALTPRLVVCDEPTSALDVSTQALILDLLRELQGRLSLAYLFITHDLAVVRHFADRVLVIQHGRLVEQGTALQICTEPAELYTRQLVAAAPVPNPALQRKRRERSAQLMRESGGIEL